MRYAFVIAAITFSIAQNSHGQEIVVFGDSMTDVGNAFALNGNPPSPPYSDGRFSNGITWVEVLADHLMVTRPKASTAGGTNFAYGGASAGSTRFGGGIVDIDQQVLHYLRNDEPRPDQLFALWGGGNDFNYYIRRLD